MSPTYCETYTPACWVPEGIGYQCIGICHRIIYIDIRTTVACDVDLIIVSDAGCTVYRMRKRFYGFPCWSKVKLFRRTSKITPWFSLATKNINYVLKIAYCMQVSTLNHRNKLIYFPKFEIYLPSSFTLFSFVPIGSPGVDEISI